MRLMRSILNTNNMQKMKLSLDVNFAYAVPKERLARGDLREKGLKI